MSLGQNKHVYDWNKDDCIKFAGRPNGSSVGEEPIHTRYTDK